MASSSTKPDQVNTMAESHVKFSINLNILKTHIISILEQYLELSLLLIFIPLISE